MMAAEQCWSEDAARSGSLVVVLAQRADVGFPAGRDTVAAFLQWCQMTLNGLVVPRGGFLEDKGNLGWCIGVG
jgi:hypothetical protein